MPSRRFFTPAFGKSIIDREQYFQNVGGAQQFRSQPIDTFAYRLFDLNIPEKRPLFDEILAKIISPAPDWTIDQNSNGQYFLKFKSNNMSFTSEGVGEGILNLFYIIDALQGSFAGDIVIIDEPEVSLHPSLQRKLMNLLLEYSKDRQIIISTHSPYFLPLDYIDKGMTIIRIYNTKEGTTFATPSISTKQNIAKNLRDLNNPHVLGLNAKELFFLDERIILVEGQEDVLLYPKIAEQLNREFKGDFFGWGVGGASKMQDFAQLLKDLGFTKVAGILDKGMENEKNNLNQKFPEYLFLDIPAADIRDKPKRNDRPEIDGLSTSDGIIKEEHKNKTKEIIDKINNYLS